MNKRFLKQITPLIVSLVLVGGMTLLVRKWGEQFERPFERLVVEALPEIPDLSSRPAALAARLDAAHSRLSDPEAQRDALAELAKLYHANGFNREAESCYLGLEGHEPQNPLWPYLIAELRSDYRDPERQILYLQRSLALDPGYAVAYWKLGDARLKAGAPEEAMADYLAGLEREPDSVWGELGLAKVALAKKDLLLARERLERMCASPNPTLACYEILPEVCLDLEDYEAAKRFRQAFENAELRSAPEDPRTAFLERMCYEPYRLLNFAERHVRAGERAEAGAVLERAWRLDPSNRDVVSALGHLYFGSGAAPELWEDFPFDAVSGALGDEGEGELAIRVAERWIAERPDSAAAYARLGRVAQASGRAELAEIGFRGAVERTEAPARARLELGMFLLSVRAAEGVTLLERSAEEEGVAYDANVALGLYYLSGDDYEKAIERLRAALALEPDRNELKGRLGNAFARRGKELMDEGRNADAISYFERAVEADAALSPAYLNLGLARGYVGEIDASVAAFERYFELEPERLNIALSLGSTLVEKGLEDLAIRLLESARDRASNEQRRLLEERLTQLRVTGGL